MLMSSVEGPMLGEVDYSQGLPSLGQGSQENQVKTFVMGPFEVGLGELLFGAAALTVGIIAWKHLRGWQKVVDTLVIIGGAGRILGGTVMAARG